MQHVKTLRDYMSQAQQRAMKGLPTYHATCREKTGVCRPGKTERDRQKRQKSSSGS